MRTFILLQFIFTSFFCYTQTTYTYTGSGEWDEEANWSPSYPGTTIMAGDKVIVSHGSTLSILFITNNGTIINKGTTGSRSTVTNNGDFINEHTYDQKSIFNNIGTFTNQGNFSNSSTFRNEGVITNNGEWSNRSLFINNSEFFNNGQFIHQSFMFGNNISHTSDFEIRSLFSPGISTGQTIGKYIFNENLFCSDNALITMEIQSISEVDLIQVSYRAKLSGSLTVKLLENYDPKIGDTYTVLTASSIIGQFSRVNFPDLGTGKEFQIIYNIDSVVLKVIDSTLSTDDVNSYENKILIHPNPSSDVLYIEGLNTLKEISIYSYLGAKIGHYVVDPLNNEIPIHSLSNGLYILSLDKYYHRFIKK